MDSPRKPSPAVPEAPEIAPGQAFAISNQAIMDRTREWLERAVIGLNLCPFAKAVQLRGQVRFVVSDATEEDALLVDLLQ